MKENSSLKKEEELKLWKRPQSDLNIKTNSARAEGNNNLTLGVRPVEIYQTAWFSVKGNKHSEAQVQISYKTTLTHQLVGTFWESQSQGRDPGAFPGTFLIF